MYILHDYMHVLHLKFVNENPTDNCSYSFFAGVRSKYRYIKLISHSTMNMCLCKTHENMRLLLKATSGLGLNRSPDEFVQQTTPEQVRVILQQLPPEVKYWEWRTVPVQYGEVTKKRVKRLQYTATRTEFIAKFVALMVTFSSHSSRVIAQYKAVHTLKETLPTGHVTVQMDFSENWTVCSSNEIQSAYFAKDQITIHPAVVHYRCNDALMHKSYILVTDERRHSAPTVFQFMKQLVPKIREDLPMNVTFVHYVTDSPSSQYRNTQMFSVLARHQELLATDASWLYFEAGHGKGPCDGVGGASKRMADDYVRRGNTILTAAEYRVFWHCVKRPATPRAVFRTGVTCLAAANGINTCCSTILPTLPKNQLTTKASHQQSTSPHSSVWVHTLWQTLTVCTSSERWCVRRKRVRCAWSTCIKSEGRWAVTPGLRQKTSSTHPRKTSFFPGFQHHWSLEDATGPSSYSGKACARR